MTKEEMGSAAWEHRVPMMRLALSIVHTRQDAEDAVSDALVRAISSAEKLRSDDKLKKWLLSITARCCYDLLRHQKREQPTDKVQLFDEPVFENDSDTSLLQKLQSLPASQATVLQLYYYDGYLAREIASILSLPLSTVLMRLRRGRQGLKAIYEAQGRDAQ